MKQMHDIIFPGNFKWLQINLDEYTRRNLPDKYRHLLVYPEFCDQWVRNIHKELGCDYSYGGYLEDRSWLWRDT